MASPHPKPTAIKKMQGTLRNDRILSDEMQLEPIKAIPNPDIHWSEKVSKEWYARATGLVKLGMFCGEYIETLRSYCTALHIMHECEDDFHKSGVTILNVQGNKVKNPSVSIWAEQQKILASCIAKFGWTPSDKTRISAPVLHKDKKENLFKRAE
ncbi:MAG: phage terminase small subunit P27 family [Bacteroidetes bacterium]|nr:phage terminase small subunit P27 family [Bacteroidota bacterium]